MSSDNKLKLKILIDAEQWQGEQQLSNWEYREDVDYPAIENASANWLTLEIRSAVQSAVDEVVKRMAQVKREADGVEGFGQNENGLIRSR